MAQKSVVKRDPAAEARALRLREVTARMRAQNDRLEGVTAGKIAPRSEEEIRAWQESRNGADHD